MEFLRSFLRRHLAGKPLVASPNVGWFVRLSFTALKEVAPTPLNQTIHYEADKVLANPGEFLVAECRAVLQILSPFRPKNVLFHTRFQTLNSIPVFRHGL